MLTHSNIHPYFLTLLTASTSSFGFTEKGSAKFSQQAIGVYGNGFKSGSMRLGRDALIFTKNGGCQTVGMLSQTFLENIKAQAVIVPIVPFSQQTNILLRNSKQGKKKKKYTGGFLCVCVCACCVASVDPEDLITLNHHHICHNKTD